MKSVIASGKDTPAQVYTDIPAGGGFTVPVKTINLTAAPLSVIKTADR